MPVRYPPPDAVPPVNRGRGLARPRKIVAYEQPGKSFSRRLGRRLLSPFVLVPLAIVFVVVVGILVYYWTIFSGRIDNLLRGDVYTRSAGIYAAPKQLRPGETISEEDLVAHLKRAGYVEKGAQAETARGRYSVNGTTVDVEPSQDSSVDGVKQFQRIRAQFAKGAKAISSLSDLDNNTRLERAWLEHKLSRWMERKVLFYFFMIGQRMVGERAQIHPARRGNVWGEMIGVFFVLHEDGAVVFIPEDIVIIALHTCMYRDVVGGDAFFSEASAVGSADRIVADVGDERRPYAESGCRYRRIRCITDRRNNFCKLIGNLIAEPHGEYAIFIIRSALHLGIFQSDKRFSDNVANGKEVHIKSLPRSAP